MIPYMAELVSCEFFGWVGVAVSVLWLLWLAEEVYRGFMNFVWSRIGPKKDFVKTYGKWAVVTGGSDGIGKGWAMEFAKRGLNICVISKDEFNITQEIRSKYPVEVKFINVDFSNPKVYDGLEKELSQLEIGVLANNVGMFLRDLELFFNTSRDNLDKMVEVNVKTVVMMTQMVLKKMVARNKGLIINIGSLSSVLPFPYATVYGACKDCTWKKRELHLSPLVVGLYKHDGKVFGQQSLEGGFGNLTQQSFVEEFSLCLEAELTGSNIQVHCVRPYFVNTNLVSTCENLKGFLSLTPIVFPRAHQFASSAAAVLNNKSLPLYTSGYWAHSLLVFFLPLKLINKSWYAKLVVLFERSHLKAEGLSIPAGPPPKKSANETSR